jgi:hypothetical protein
MVQFFKDPFPRNWGTYTNRRKKEKKISLLQLCWRKDNLLIYVII